MHVLGACMCIYRAGDAVLWVQQMVVLSGPHQGRPTCVVRAGHGGHCRAGCYRGCRCSSCRGSGGSGRWCWLALDICRWVGKGQGLRRSAEPPDPHHRCSRAKSSRPFQSKLAPPCMGEHRKPAVPHSLGLAQDTWQCPSSSSSPEASPWASTAASEFSNLKLPPGLTSTFRLPALPASFFVA